MQKTQDTHRGTSFPTVPVDCLRSPLFPSAPRADSPTMTSTPDLSVVIVSYECRDHLLTVLDDLAQAGAVFPLEVLVVDNASTDGTVEAVWKRHPWVQLEALNENLGFGRANNRAIRRAHANTLLLLNPDTRVTAEALLSCTTELRRLPHVGVLTPRTGVVSVVSRRCGAPFAT